MKIVYAANQRIGAHFQLNRFIKANNKHQIKIAAFNNQNYIVDVDWLLDAVCDTYTTKPFYNGIAMEVYHDQIKQYVPDLIISDCEVITTKIAYDLNIPVWQVSPLLLYKALPDQISLRSKYPTLFKSYSQQMKEFDKSDRLFIYSHLADCGIQSKLEWIRPYAQIGNTSELFQHNMVAAHIDNHRPLLHKLKDDVVFFTETKYEHYPITIKHFNNEYANSIKNAKSIIVLGCEDLLADAFYNNQFAYMIPDFYDQEVMMSISFNEYLVFGKILYNIKDKIEPMPPIDIEYSNAKFLDEAINEL